MDCESRLLRAAALPSELGPHRALRRSALWPSSSTRMLAGSIREVSVVDALPEERPYT